MSPVVRAARLAAALLRAEPALAAGTVVLVDFVLILAGAPKPAVVALTGFLGPLLLAVRKVVIPVATAAQAVVDSAVAAASQTAARLDEITAGEVGEITEDGLEAVAAAVEDSVAVVLDGVGLNPKGRKVVLQ